jgi:hypothetical protein
MIAIVSGPDSEGRTRSLPPHAREARAQRGGRERRTERSIGSAVSRSVKVVEIGYFAKRGCDRAWIKTGWSPQVTGAGKGAASWWA